MAEVKTKKNNADVPDFLNSIEPQKKQEDCKKICELMAKTTGAEPKMWGSSIIGFGTYHYVYASGREGDWFLSGFSPRKQNITLYIMNGFSQYDALLGQLGKHKTGKSCLYINKLEDIDWTVLEKLVSGSVTYMKGKYRC